MKYFLTTLLFLFYACASTKESEVKSLDPSSKSSNGKPYSQLVDMAIENPDSVNYQEVRISYSESKIFSPYLEPEEFKKMRTLINEKKYNEVIQITKKNIRNYFAELDIHYYSLIAYKELKDENAYQWHRFVLNKLIDSIANSGDGKSTKNAFVVIAVREEYSFMGLLGIEHKSQHLVNEKGHAFDMFDVNKSQNFNSSKIYFNIDIPMAALSKSLGR